MNIKRIRYAMVTLLIAAVTIRVLWWTIEPLIPLAVVALVLIGIYNFIWKKATRL